MCGIAGIIGRIDEDNRLALWRMSAALSHRGPDAQAAFEAPPDGGGWGAMLAHRRLAILDLSATGAQPMVDPVTGHVVVFNGEIYNYVEIRERLVAQGQSFESSGDTSVMLRAVALHGCDALRWLRGMFAFALWDPRGRKLTLARDPLGIKPLYVARNPDARSGWALAFASEVRALLASGLLCEPKLNPRAVASVAWNGFVVAPDTAIQGIEPLWPGELCTFEARGGEALRAPFWVVPGPEDQEPIEEAHFAAEVRRCVSLHLASDVPLGVFLSSGIDSAAIANLARQVSREPVHTFTLSFEDREYDEAPLARRVAEAIGTRHQHVPLTEHSFTSQLDVALESLDQPTFDGLNSYYLAHAVRQAGFKVALAGTGGDELFGGYASFRHLPALLRWSHRTSWMPLELRLSVAKLLSRTLQPATGLVAQQTRWAKLPEMVRRGDDLLSLYQIAYGLFLPDFQRQLLSGDVADTLTDGLPKAMRSRLAAETASRSALSAISVLEQRLFLGERLLRDTDAASMASSIEIRLPFVDQVLFATANRLSDRQRFYPIRSKAILRRTALHGLDPELWKGRKKGFVLPFDRWIRRGLGKIMDRTMRDPAAVKPVGLNPEAVARLWEAYLRGSPGIYWSRIWAIYVLIRWCHRHRAYL